ncbi:DUF3817 domain-containing protein [Acidipropionibacterium jensenii]|uniref:DUF3817 domain-containing protein n=1 Tax=Acidipropionibacterium jensenii TaxID=1749 RepID=UPI00214A8FE7
MPDQPSEQPAQRPTQHPLDDVTSDAFYQSADDPEPAPGRGAAPVADTASDGYSASRVAEDSGELAPEDIEPWIAPEEIPAVKGALLRYRVMAYLVGTLLIVLVCIAMPLKYWADMPQMTSVVGVAHGWLYALLLITAYMLGRKAGWPLWRLAVIALAGTVPFLSFVAEYYARTDVQRRIGETKAYYADHPVD